MAHDEKKIDREHLKKPREVSGWSDPLHPSKQQDFSDIARHTEKNPEFEDKGVSTREPLGKGKSD